MADARVRSKVPGNPKNRVCSRCHQEKPAAQFRGKRPGPAEFAREFKCCAPCRDQLRELQRAKAAELAWLREEALVPYANRRRRSGAK